MYYYINMAGTTMQYSVFLGYDTITIVNGAANGLSDGIYQASGAGVNVLSNITFLLSGTTNTVTNSATPYVGILGIAGIILSWEAGCYEITNSTSIGNTITFQTNNANTSTITTIATISPFFSLFFYIAADLTVTIQESACCIRGDALVKTKRGDIMIKNVIHSDTVFKSDGSEIDVQYNIKFISTKKFVKINQNALGENIPNQDIFITGEHPISINNKEINVKDLVNNTTITEIETEIPEPIYSLCTSERTCVMINGLSVYTWGDADWNDFSKENNITAWKQ
jgi:hypothetical protein